jgi:hypothetical protein
MSRAYRVKKIHSRKKGFLKTFKFLVGVEASKGLNAVQYLYNKVYMFIRLSVGLANSCLPVLLEKYST